MSQPDVVTIKLAPTTKSGLGRTRERINREVAAAVADKVERIENDVETRRVQVAAMLFATREFSREEIGEVLELCPKHLHQLMCSPLFQALVRGYRGVIPSPEQIAEKIMRDAPRNVAFIKRVRDGRVPGTPEALRVRTKAAEMLLDRQAPKRMALETEETKRTVIIETHQLDRMRQLMGPIDSGVVVEALDESATTPLVHDDGAEA